VTIREDGWVRVSLGGAVVDAVTAGHLVESMAWETERGTIQTQATLAPPNHGRVPQTTISPATPHGYTRSQNQARTEQQASRQATHGFFERNRLDSLRPCGRRTRMRLGTRAGRTGRAGRKTRAGLPQRPLLVHSTRNRPAEEAPQNSELPFLFDETRVSRCFGARVACCPGSGRSRTYSISKQ
jgi:hypothetical protein